MIRPGVKFRGTDRFLTPQPHQSVFRSSGAGVPTQPITSKLILGWDFSGINSTVTVTGQGISGVTDTSGNGNAGTQTTDSRRCLYGTDTINGKLIADSGDARSVNMPADVAGWTHDGMPPLHSLCIVRIETFTNGDYIWHFSTAGNAPRCSLRLSTSGGTRFEARLPITGPSATIILSTETAIATGTTYLVEVSGAIGGAGSLVVNEGTAATGGTLADTAEALSVRRLFDVTSPADAWCGALYLFNDVLTGGELAEWRTFLKDRWGYV